MQTTQTYKTLAVALVGFAAAMGLATFGWYGWRQLLRHGSPMRLDDWRPYLPIFGGMLACGVVAYASLKALDRLGARPPQ